MITSDGQKTTIKVPSPWSTHSSSLLYLFYLSSRLQIGFLYSRLFVKDDLFLPLSANSSDLKLKREIGYAAFKINALITGIDRSKSNIELPTVKAPSSDSIDMNAVLMRAAVYGSDIGTISSEVRSKVKSGELLVLPKANPRSDQFFRLWWPGLLRGDRSEQRGSKEREDGKHTRSRFHG